MKVIELLFSGPFFISCVYFDQPRFTATLQVPGKCSLSVKIAYRRQKPAEGNFIFQRLKAPVRCASMVLIYETCILIDQLNVLAGSKRREGTFSGGNVRECGFFDKSKKIRKWYPSQLLKNSCYTALPTLRLLRIIIATKYVNFSVIIA